MSRLFTFLPLLLAVACSKPVDDGQFDDILVLTGDAESGAVVYADLCAECHGGGGEGDGHAPALSGSDAEDVLNSVLSGPGLMPDFAAEPDQDLADLLAYVDTL